MLNDKLDQYIKEGYYPFHMPGHKRNIDLLNKNLPYNRDITEICGFDNLNDPESLFVFMEEALAHTYEAKEAIISTNGSTGSILATMRSLSKKNKKILISRFAHKSVFNGIELFDLDVDYIKTKVNDQGIISDIDYEDFGEKLETNTYDFVLLTSPTYEGYLLDLKKVHNLCKRRETPLIIDMAHGSHIHLYDDYKEYSSYDLAITSFHKNLSALTPASCILINDEGLDSKEIRRNMAIFQTSSPSYVVCQSIDDMIFSHPKFPILKENLDINLDLLYKLDLKNLEFVNDDRKDRTKILISTKNTNISGYKLQELLLERKIEIEMAQATYALLISTIFDEKEGFENLKSALMSIDQTLEKSKSSFDFKNIIPKKAMKISKAMESEKNLLDIEKASGKICGQYIYSYPPGIPMIVPGEVFSEDLIKEISYLKTVGANLSYDDGKVFIVN
ncbi:MAG: aminotransferase class I/II-fold pyridoxal phosphate-dependent enzyme [Anaerococcus sp.]|nr:aminotransferase class I/II-fold pyridoxal phosphate-dependent enzyme [Peptoniphilaceae bacterium]MDY3055276.1 aminotransferase class I/II-fold pyridoxal phosphate-dependent enzyme [Anaerococcus sp.]